MKNALGYFPKAVPGRTAGFALLFLLVIASCGPKQGADNEIPVTTSSEEALSHYNTGRDLADVGNGLLAREHYDKAIELDPTFSRAYLSRAGNATSTEQFKADLELAEENLEGKSDGEKILVMLNRTFLNNDTEERLKLAKQLVVVYPKSARALNQLGACYANISSHDSARATYQKSIEIAPAWVGGYFSLGTSYMNTEPKDFVKAEQNFLKVVELQPGLPGSHIYLGDVYRASNELEKARDSYQKAIDLNPNDPLNYYKRGHIYSFLGSYEEARADYRKAGELNTQDKINPIVFEANTYIYAGDPKTARTWLEEQANSLDKIGVPAHQMNAAAYTFITNSTNIAFHQNETTELFRLVELMRPLAVQAGEIAGTEEAKLGQKNNILNWEALALAQKGDFAGATAKAEEGKTTMDPIKNPNKLWGYHNVMAYIAYKQGKYEDAIAHQEQSNPNAPYNKYWLGMACEKAGQAERAGKVFDELSTHNFNAIGWALVRNEVVAKKKPV